MADKTPCECGREDRRVCVLLGCGNEEVWPDAHYSAESTVPRCRHTSASPWGPSQCALPDGYAERHAYSPSEALEDDDAET